MKPAVSLIPVRDVAYQVRTWGDPGRRALFLLHGWLDVGASFHGVAEALAGDWHVIAPDWRGYGRSGRSPGYWIPDYVADLDALLQHFSPDRPAALVGHSVGGNLCTLYTAIRPERVAALVSVEGFGFSIDAADAAPRKLRTWVAGIQKPVTAPALTPAMVAAALRQHNPGLPAERAAALAAEFIEPHGDGWRQLSDPLHRVPYPLAFREDEWLAYLRALRTPVLWVEGGSTALLQILGITADQLAVRRAAVTGLEHRVVPGCGHGVHVEQPAALAALVAEFLARRVT